MKTELKAVFGLVVLVRRRGTLNTSHNTQTGHLKDGLMQME